MRNLIDFITEAQNKKEFLIIKPEFLHHRNDILEILKENQIIPIRELRKTLSMNEAKKLYKPHSKEDFYEDLCKYMSSGDSIGFVLCNYGNADLLKIKDSIRKKFGVDEMRNAVHSSDSGLNVHRESKIYFATSDI
jgi:nucleoside-diphosphate kinase